MGEIVYKVFKIMTKTKVMALLIVAIFSMALVPAKAVSKSSVVNKLSALKTIEQKRSYIRNMSATEKKALISAFAPTRIEKIGGTNLSSAKQVSAYASKNGCTPKEIGVQARNGNTILYKILYKFSYCWNNGIITSVSGKGLSKSTPWYGYSDMIARWKFVSDGEANSGYENNKKEWFYYRQAQADLCLFTTEKVSLGCVATDYPTIDFTAKPEGKIINRCSIE